MAKITFVEDAIFFKVAVITSSVIKISLFVDKINIVVAELIFKVVVFKLSENCD